MNASGHLVAHCFDQALLNTTLIPRLHDQANIEQPSKTHRANVEQTSSKYEACIKHCLHEANIKQTSTTHPASSSS